MFAERALPTATPLSASVARLGLGVPLFAFIVAVALGAASSGATPPQGSLKAWFVGEDYPPAALERNEQGDVSILVHVDTTGSVSDCVVEQSSGSALLDAKTCEVLRQRAKLIPAKDQHGRPVAGEARAKIRWRIAQDDPEGESLQGLFRAEDYPVAALDQNKQGVVGVLIRVDVAGAISSCTVEESSGFAPLDEQTCKIVRSRARMKVAKDANGKPIPHEFRSHIHWRIAAEPGPSDPWAWRSTIVLNSDGDVMSCTVQLEGALNPTGSTKAQACPPNSQLPKFYDYPPVKTTVVTEIRFVPSIVQPSALAAGDVLLSRQVITVKVDEKGKRLSCAVTQRTGEDMPGDACEALGQEFKPRIGSDGKPVSFTGTEIVTTYAHLEM